MEIKDRVLAPEIIEAYKKLDTTEVADAINRFGYNTGMFGLNCIVSGTKVCGQAFTVLFGVCQGGFEGKMDYLDDVPAGNVIVIDTPVVCGGMAIMPGDILVGDADGLVVIRPEDAKEVAEKALKQNEAERNLLKIIDEGKWDRSNFAVTLEKMGCEIID